MNINAVCGLTFAKNSPKTRQNRTVNNNIDDTFTYTDKKQTKNASKGRLALCLLALTTLLNSGCSKKEEPQTQPSSTPEIVFQEPEKIEYEVKRGDNLTLIVKDFLGKDTDPQIIDLYINQIAKDNDMDPNDILQIGQKLDITCLDDGIPNREYTVKKGDTLTSIAKRYLGDDVSYDEMQRKIDNLCLFNGIKDPNSLKEGDTLCINTLVYDWWDEYIYSDYTGDDFIGVANDLIKQSKEDKEH